MEVLSRTAFKKTPRMLMVFEQSFDFSTQRRVIFADFREERESAFGRKL